MRFLMNVQDVDAQGSVTETAYFPLKFELVYDANANLPRKCFRTKEGSAGAVTCAIPAIVAHPSTALPPPPTALTLAQQQSESGNAAVLSLNQQLPPADAQITHFTVHLQRQPRLQHGSGIGAIKCLPRQPRGIEGFGSAALPCTSVTGWHSQGSAATSVEMKEYACNTTAKLSVSSLIVQLSHPLTSLPSPVHHSFHRNNVSTYRTLPLYLFAPTLRCVLPQSTVQLLLPDALDCDHSFAATASAVNIRGSSAVSAASPEFTIPITQPSPSPSATPSLGSSPSRPPAVSPSAAPAHHADPLKWSIIVGSAGFGFTLLLGAIIMACCFKSQRAKAAKLAPPFSSGNIQSEDWRSPLMSSEYTSPATDTPTSSPTTSAAALGGEVEEKPQQPGTPGTAVRERSEPQRQGGTDASDTGTTEEEADRSEGESGSRGAHQEGTNHATLPGRQGYDFGAFEVEQPPQPPRPGYAAPRPRAAPVMYPPSPLSHPVPTPIPPRMRPIMMGPRYPGTPPHMVRTIDLPAASPPRSESSYASAKTHRTRPGMPFLSPQKVLARPAPLHPAPAFVQGIPSGPHRPLFRHHPPHGRVPHHHRHHHYRPHSGGSESEYSDEMEESEEEDEHDVESGIAEGMHRAMELNTYASDSDDSDNGSEPREDTSPLGTEEKEVHHRRGDTSDEKLSVALSQGKILGDGSSDTLLSQRHAN